MSVTITKNIRRLVIGIIRELSKVILFRTEKYNQSFEKGRFNAIICDHKIFRSYFRNVNKYSGCGDF